MPNPLISKLFLSDTMSFFNLETDRLLKITLPPVYIEKSGRTIGEIQFRKFQEAFMDCPTHWAILQTPTGSGKTLAALSRILFQSECQRGIFIYPTNELINDQLTSMKSLIEKLGFKTFIVGAEDIQEEEGWVRTLFEKLSSQEYVILFAINGATLFEYKTKLHSSKGKILFRILEIINSRNVPSILLTNIDTLYLILKEKYSESVRILDRLINWRHLVIDEFHLYSGISLINLVYTIILYYLFIKEHVSGDFSINLLSATPSNALTLITRLFHDEITIFQTTCHYNMQSEPNFSMIRKNTDLFIYARENFLFRAEDMDFLYGIVKNIIKLPNFQQQSKGKHVCLLILVNSMIFAENFYRYLKAKADAGDISLRIERIHGMIPSHKRVKISELNEHLLIGTRAIEIGIDFDVPFLIFEGFDKATFFQRLGRGGRHNDCVQFCITSNLLVNKIKQTLDSLDKISRPELSLTLDDLIDCASDSLIEEETHIEFLYSNDGIRLMVPFIESLAETSEQRQDFYESLDKILHLSEKTIPVKEWSTCLRPSKLRAFLAQCISARSNLIDFPCYFEKFDCWTRLSLLDLSNCIFHLTTFQDLQNRDPPRLWLNNQNQPVVYVHDITPKKHFIRIGTTSGVLKWGFVYLTTIERKLIVEGDLTDDAKEILNDLLATITIPFVIVPRSTLDWKIPQFEYLSDRNLRIVLGENAFLAKYLFEKGSPNES